MNGQTLATGWQPIPEALRNLVTVCPCGRPAEWQGRDTRSQEITEYACGIVHAMMPETISAPTPAEPKEKDTGGRPRSHASNADRQRAYRQRQKGVQQ